MLQGASIYRLLYIVRYGRRELMGGRVGDDHTAIDGYRDVANPALARTRPDMYYCCCCCCCFGCFGSRRIIVGAAGCVSRVLRSPTISSTATCRAPPAPADHLLFSRLSKMDEGCMFHVEERTHSLLLRIHLLIYCRYIY